jgi:hypothetical protein
VVVLQRDKGKCVRGILTKTFLNAQGQCTEAALEEAARANGYQTRVSPQVCRMLVESWVTGSYPREQTSTLALESMARKTSDMQEAAELLYESYFRRVAKLTARWGEDVVKVVASPEVLNNISMQRDLFKWIGAEADSVEAKFVHHPSY